MHKAERVSRSGPKLSDAQTRNLEAIKYIGRGIMEVALEIPVKGTGADPANELANRGEDPAD